MINNKDSTPSAIPTIYRYTEELLKAQEDSLNRIDNKLNILSLLSITLLILCLNLPSSTNLQEILRLISSFLFFLASFYSLRGMSSVMSGKAADPKRLMEDDWFFDKEEPEHQCYIINSWIDILDKEYTPSLIRKGKRLNIVVKTFLTALVFFFITRLLFI